MRYAKGVQIKLIILLALIACVVVVLSTRVSPSVIADYSPRSTFSPAETLESCLKCHDKIEPMHKFGPTATLDKLDHGKDALGLTCTACHGGNPVAIEKETAHVRPRFPRQWLHDG